ncbi:MAG: iron-sulfur cluster carrier protein ApbC [Acidobacteria bacterium]|nr:iron-sulfur cluster carrier protein ApbC [Acidobacteriota bacterium]
MGDVVSESQVLGALRSVRDPDLNRDIVSLGFVKDIKICGGAVSFTIELTTPACPVRDQMKEQARAAVQSLNGVEQVQVTMTSQVRSSSQLGIGSMIQGVKNVIPVASGKGGVGKSTVSANLALALAQSGATVGLMDADIYGPSIPTILGVPDYAPQPSPTGRILPVIKYGIKVISMGFFLPRDKAVIWRGPMLDKMVSQFLGGVEWGELDYLLVDLPPGTGDVQLSLCQKIPLTGATIVSTPQDVALKVAEKAIIMFKQLNCPILGLVENMSYYVCSHCGQRDEIFGSGGARRLSEELQLPFLGEIPVATGIRLDSDRGCPTVVSEPGSFLAKAFFDVASNLAAQISIRNLSGELKQDIKVSF